VVEACGPPTSGNIGWVVSLGIVKGKRKFRSFPTLEQAQAFKAKCIEKEALNNPGALSDMSELGRASVRLAIEKLKPFDADIGQAVDFYLKHAKPARGKINIQEAIDLFVQKKEDENASPKYIKTASRCFFAPFRGAFHNCLTTEITSDQAHTYIHKRENWNFTSKNTHNRHLRALYTFLIKEGYATQNPFNSVPFAKERSGHVKEKISPPSDVRTLLQYSLDHGYKAECASLVLVFFCGVRIEEASRINWDQIHLNGSKSFVDIVEAKNNRRRVNVVPANATHWLRACYTDGAVAPDNYEKRMQRLRKKAKIAYPQNCARHCFASYHIAFHGDAAKTAAQLGHPNAVLLYNTYRQLVAEEAAREFWDIVPKFVTDQRIAEKEARKRRLGFDSEELQKECEEQLATFFED
jgi:integrase